MEGFLCRKKKQAAPTDPEFFPENVEFLGFIGGWDCYIGIDTVQNLFYLIRTNDLDCSSDIATFS